MTHPTPATFPDRDAAAVRSVRQLQNRRTYPSISLLAPRSGRADADRLVLERMLDEVGERLALEYGPEEVGPLAAAIEEQIAGLGTGERAGASGSVAIFVSADVALTRHLDVAVRPRVVIDATFATRDLVLELGRRPSYWVLTLGDGRTRLFAGRGPDLEEVVGGGFPILRDEDDPQRARPAADRAARSAQLAAYARKVETLLGEHLGDRADPVLVAGQTRRLAAVTARPGLATRSGARLAVNLELAPVQEIAARIDAEVATMIAVHVERAIAEVGAAVGSGRGVEGLDATWRLANEGRVGLLVAERGFEVAVMLHEDGLGFDRVADPAAPRVTDDLVDELIETVLAKGGDVVVVDDGVLEGSVGVAAVLRY